MLLRTFPRAMRADLRRVLWRWTRPKRSPALVELERRRTLLRASHKSTKAIDQQARAIKHAQLRSELGVTS